jgi:hypothetical protein
LVRNMRRELLRTVVGGLDWQMGWGWVGVRV